MSADAPHIPVLLAEVVAALEPRRGGTILDGTFGAGGYARAILAASATARVVGMDRDPGARAAAAALAAAEPERFAFVPGRFSDLAAVAADRAPAGLAGVVLDIGVSSMQLDEAERGFSFRQDGPLDMRMEREGPSAADLVNGLEEAEIADILYHYGEERRSRAIARAVVARRRTAPFATTADLAALVAGIVRGEPGHHPATRTFQALRIAVNDELGELAAALAAAEAALAPGGRLAVVTFHSLEDRVVKQFLTGRTGRGAQGSRHMPGRTETLPPSFVAPVRGPVLPGEEECRRNPRARSAKLRWAERTEAPAPSGPEAEAHRPRLVPVRIGGAR